MLIKMPVRYDEKQNEVCGADDNLVCYPSIVKSNRAAERGKEIVTAINEHAALKKMLADCVTAIKTLPEDVFGIGNSSHGQTSWYIRNELIGRAEEALKESEKENDESA